MTTATLLVVQIVIVFAHMSDEVKVNVAVLLPFNDSYLFSLHRVAPAIEIAIEELNHNIRLLNRNHLIVKFYNSKCDIGYTMNNVIDFYSRKEVRIS